MRTAWFSRVQVVEMVRRGELTDAQSIAALGLWLLREQRSAPRP
jgi:hypothetical protein